MQEKWTHIFQLRTPPSRAWHTASAPEGFAELKESFCQQLSQKWNDNKKSDDGRKKMDRLLILRELVKILQVDQRRRWK